MFRALIGHCMLGRDEGMYDDAAAGRCQIFSLFLDKPQPLSDFLLIQVPYPAYRYRYLPRYGTAVLVDWNRRTANGKRFIGNKPKTTAIVNSSSNSDPYQADLEL